MLEDVHQLSLRVEFITMQKEGRTSDRLHYKLHGRMAALDKPSVTSMPEENLTDGGNYITHLPFKVP